MSLKNLLFSCQGFIGDLKLLIGRESDQNMNHLGIGIVLLGFGYRQKPVSSLERKNPIGNFGRRPATKCYLS